MAQDKNGDWGSNELVAAMLPLIDAGENLIRYQELERLMGADIRGEHGRGAFYHARRKLLKTREVWLENVQQEGYRVVRAGPVIERAKRVEQAKQEQRAKYGREWYGRRNAPARPSAPPEPGSAREWVEERRGQPPNEGLLAPPKSPELPRLELGRDALERLGQAALAQMYREVARTLAEMAEQYAALAEQTLAGVK